MTFPRRFLPLTFMCAALLLVASSCGSSSSASKAQLGPTPCEDSLYRALKTKQFNKLSPNQREYIQKMDDSCDRYERMAAMDKASTSNGVKVSISPLTVVLYVLSLAATVYAIIQFTHKHD